MGHALARVSIALVALVVATGVALAPVSAADPAGGQITADLEGRPIAVSEIPDWFCHDLDFPQIHCYRTPAKLEHALDLRITAALAGEVGTRAVIPYVIVYRDATYAGPNTAIAQPYDDLGLIGWNDMISSFKAVNGLSGHFATDARNSGRLYPGFCCNVQVSYVGDAWNDQFSSVYPW